MLDVVGGLMTGGCLAGDVQLFPPLFTMNQPLAQARPRIEAACDRTREIEYTGAQAAPFDHQTQIDCFHVPLFGKPRKVEFMFNEGSLEFLWVLLETDELQAIETQIAEAYGPVEYENGNDKVFAAGTVALRARPPEILIGTKELVADITGYGTAPE